MAIIYFLQSIYNNTIFIYKKLIISKTGASWFWTWNVLAIDLSPASGWLWYLAVLPKSPRRPTTQHYFCVSHQALGLFINGIKWRTAVSNSHLSSSLQRTVYKWRKTSLHAVKTLCTMLSSLELTVEWQSWLRISKSPEDVLRSLTSCVFHIQPSLPRTAPKIFRILLDAMDAAEPPHNT